ncbi:hypothetical protein C3L33_12544, partial [Rhododendron williamsianum]
MAEDENFTNDGTVDIHKNPANKKETGNWKACRFIVGTVFKPCSLFRERKKKEDRHVALTGGPNTPLGMTLLTLSASVKGLKPSCENDICHPTSSQTAVCFIALYLIALGTGGITPCVSSFGADQFDETDETEKKKKSSYFNWYYMSINVGALIASSVLVWIQMNVGWGWGFGIPAVALAIAVVFFFSGSRLYRLQKPGGSALTRMFQVLVASLRKSNVKVPEDKSLLYETIDEECNIEGSCKLEHTGKLR